MPKIEDVTRQAAFKPKEVIRTFTISAPESEFLQLEQLFSRMSMGAKLSKAERAQFTEFTREFNGAIQW